MIRVLMLGRTGNNLFQYAMGRVLSEKHQVPLVMEGSWFNREGWQSVRHLRQLPIKAKLVRDPTPASRLLRKITGKHRWDFLPLPCYREKSDDVSFDPAVLDLPASCVLSGYFQSPLYFNSIESRLREEIQFHDRKLDATSSEAARMIGGSESVAIHIRRTDYIGNPNTDICGQDYYETAIKRIRKLTCAPTFFIFSDDPAWCRAQYHGPDFHVIDCPASGLDPLNDLHLMSLARHHIIANSSYSWWGAWIGKKPGQNVLLPQVWFDGIHSPIEEKKLPGWEIIQTHLAPLQVRHNHHLTNAQLNQPLWLSRQNP